MSKKETWNDRIGFIVPPSDKTDAMLSIKESCEKAGVAVPKEVTDYLTGKRDLGDEVKDEKSIQHVYNKEGELLEVVIDVRQVAGVQFIVVRKA